MKCIQCNKEFEAKRSTARYCSPACRKLAFLKVSVPEVSVPVVTDKDLIKPLGTPERLKTYTDHCHFCNTKFGHAPDGEQLIGWICANCISKYSKAQ